MNEVKAVIISETDQNGIREEEILVIEPFRLTVGLEYVMFCKELVKIVHESEDQFLGVWNSSKGPQTFWYTSAGFIIDNEREVQDPFDIKRLHRNPDMVFLIRKDGNLTGNNCFLSEEAAQTAAAQRGGRVVPFLEVMEE